MSKAEDAAAKASMQKAAQTRQRLIKGSATVVKQQRVLRGR